MFGWEFPPHIAGGLGTACYGLTKGLAKHDVEVLFVMPSASGDEDQSAVKIEINKPKIIFPPTSPLSPLIESSTAIFLVPLTKARKEPFKPIYKGPMITSEAKGIKPAIERKYSRNAKS